MPVAKPPEHWPRHPRHHRIAEHPRVVAVDAFEHSDVRSAIGPQNGWSKEVACFVKYHGAVHLAAEADRSHVPQMVSGRAANNLHQCVPPQRWIDLSSIVHQVGGVSLASHPQKASVQIKDHGLQRSGAEIES